LLTKLKDEAMMNYELVLFTDLPNIQGWGLEEGYSNEIILPVINSPPPSFASFCLNNREK
jgi:hypothetical protein